MAVNLRNWQKHYYFTALIKEEEDHFCRQARPPGQGRLELVWRNSGVQASRKLEPKETRDLEYRLNTSTRNRDTSFEKHSKKKTSRHYAVTVWDVYCHDLIL